MGRLRLPQKGVLTGVAGFFSGLLNTSTSMSGPPVLILLAGQGLPKDQFRRTLVSFFFVSGLVAALVLAILLWVDGLADAPPSLETLRNAA